MRLILVASLWPVLVSALAPLEALRGKRVLVVGGSGRVGGSCVQRLVQCGVDHVTVGGTQEGSFLDAQQRWVRLLPNQRAALESVDFANLDREKAASVQEVLANQYDLVIHTAGPFQGKVGVPNGVLEACTIAKVPYVDVCDDYCTASAAKTKHHAKAVANDVPCLVSTGCWPGVSSLMAKQLVYQMRQANPAASPSDLTCNFSFFTAGSGGAGVTLLVATFLILAEQALTIRQGRRRPVPPMQEYSTVNFGPVVGDKPVAPLNLLETASVHDVLGVGNVQALFGTAPGFWNTLLGVMAKLPDSLLSNEDLMRKLSIFSMPIVRAVDAIAGATNAMRCDILYENQRATAIYAHENLEPCVGECVVALAGAVLSGAVPAGVWFPEEGIDAGDDAASVLQAASIGAHTTTTEGDGIPLNRELIWGPKEGVVEAARR